MSFGNVRIPVKVNASQVRPYCLTFYRWRCCAWDATLQASWNRKSVFCDLAGMFGGQKSMVQHPHAECGTFEACNLQESKVFDSEAAAAMKKVPVHTRSTHARATILLPHSTFDTDPVPMRASRSGMKKPTYHGTALDLVLPLVVAKSPHGTLTTYKNKSILDSGGRSKLAGKAMSTTGRSNLDSWTAASMPIRFTGSGGSVR